MDIVTTTGPVRGRDTAYGTAFHGVPYAAGPTGAARFAAPNRTSRRPPRKLVAPAIRRPDHGRRWSKTASRNQEGGPATPGRAHALQAYGPARTPVTAERRKDAEAVASRSQGQANPSH
ncbi:hypothetical protein GCM10010172_18830 [Paractinoplanes ferrugineus]|uniref:Carboxylesterase type B domain-containing protein n=1 Tax=Paractinoplanes ferrugineus TaxID=113564 RepID=A0A919JBN7_9ACTN|nr:hypothetical protein Afe05nite_85330 [Actinoplanes ferrugineus]